MAIVKGKELNNETMIALSIHYDNLDRADERNSCKELIYKYNLDKINDDFEAETEKENIDWDHLRRQQLDEFLGIADGPGADMLEDHLTGKYRGK